MQTKRKENKSHTILSISYITFWWRAVCVCVVSAETVVRITYHADE